jgi:hypothetical protein
MAASIRLLTGLTLLAAALGGLDAACPGWLEDLGRGRLPSSAASSVLLPRQQEHEVLAERTEVRRQVVRRLAAGELTLFEAAARFGVLNRTPEELPDRGWRLLPGGCDGEKLCRQVMQWAESDLASVMPPRKGEALIRGWQAELAAHIARHGRVVLPES